MHSTTAKLSAAEGRARELQQAQQADFRRELCASLWLPHECDASVVLRQSHLMVQGGLQMPRAQAGTGLSGAVSVLRHIGETSSQAPEPHRC